MRIKCRKKRPAPLELEQGRTDNAVAVRVDLKAMPNHMLVDDDSAALKKVQTNINAVKNLVKQKKQTEGQTFRYVHEAGTAHERYSEEELKEKCAAERPAMISFEQAQDVFRCNVLENGFGEKYLLTPERWLYQHLLGSL